MTNRRVLHVSGSFQGSNFFFYTCNSVLTARPLASFSAASWRRLRSAMSSFLTASTNGVEKPATQEGVEDCASSVSSFGKKPGSGSSRIITG